MNRVSYQKNGLAGSVERGIESHVMTVAMTAVGMFALWTCALQAASFAGVSWSTLSKASAWLAWPGLAFSFLVSRQIAAAYAAELPSVILFTTNRSTVSTWCIGALAAAVCVVAASYSVRFALIVAMMIGCMVAGYRWRGANVTVDPKAGLGGRPSDWVAFLCIAALAGIVVCVVIFANRSDFDDAEYIQLGLQTLRYPERPPNTFDTSLGFVLEYFRFAPYRIVSYETFIALLAQWTGSDLLDIYYLAMPSAAAAVSVLVAFLFLRWLLPLSWALLALALFVCITLAWGETHFAYGNRLYVRMFQGKALLIAITTPLTILLALLLVRRPTPWVLAGLAAVQVTTVGVSSSGIVTALVATMIGLSAGFALSPSWSSLRAVTTGLATLAYPVAMALWLKLGNSRAGDIAALGSIADIGSSLGAGWRQGVVAAILAAAVWLTVAAGARSSRSRQSTADHAAPICFGLLVIASFLIALNPVVSTIASSLVAKNMSWRLAWSAPIPLLLAAAFAFALAWATAQSSARARYLHGLLPVGLLVAFLVQLPKAPPQATRWTLAAANGVSWGRAQHKVPPEHGQALVLAGMIEREAGKRGRPLTVLVEPQVGTWLTVVAPELQLVMPGHGYPITLQTVMDKADFARRTRLLQLIDEAAAHNQPEFERLLSFYRVDVMVLKRPGPQPEFVLKWRTPE